MNERRFAMSYPFQRFGIHLNDLSRYPGPLQSIANYANSQRAAIAAELANMRQGERTDIQPSANSQKVSAADAAGMLNVSERTVASAKKVIDSGDDELADMVRWWVIP